MRAHGDARPQRRGNPGVRAATRGNPRSSKEARVSDPYDPLDPEEADYAEEDLERQISEMNALKGSGNPIGACTVWLPT